MLHGQNGYVDGCYRLSQHSSAAKQTALEHATERTQSLQGGCYDDDSPMTVEHFLQDCQTLQNLRADTWPADTAVREKLCGPVENFPYTTAYVPATGVPV